MACRRDQGACRAKFRPTGLASGPTEHSTSMMIRTGESGESPIRATRCAGHRRAPVKAQPGSIVATMPRKASIPTQAVKNLACAAGRHCGSSCTGKRIFHGEVSNGTCAGATDRCREVRSAPISPANVALERGSLAGLTKSISRAS